MPIREQHFTIAAPPDFELGLPREPLSYSVYTPEDGEGGDADAKRPLLFFIGGFGFRRDGDYVAGKLVPHLVSKGFVTVTVSYHGSLVRTTSDPSFTVRPDWFDDFRRVSGVTVPDDPKAVIALLRANGVAELPPEFSVIKHCGNDYESFGTLGALDHLQVYGDMIRRGIAFDRQRVAAFGTSHGAYLAMMMLKFAPHTLSAVIENSCWVHAIETEMNNLWQPHRHHFDAGGVRVYYSNFSPWTRDDPSDPGHLKPAHLEMRDLRGDHYRGASGAAVISYHGADDQMIPADDKRGLWDRLKTHVDLRTTMVTADKVDGRLFKNTLHGLDASLIGLFDDAMARLGDIPTRPGDDFQRAEMRTLKCGGAQYEIDYRTDCSFRASLR
ncbi:DUF2920 family protein [Hwanghaeella grinnelliae]|uniref:DUF2920 family protein n=1 Tax=Hwanghaeella grinnelliae TaxID=2500179 RepID=A0A437QTJ5_9PROT|nr:DUF2920 family protein [Hwanghaeella grinnelliae]RVU37837.1 DUF2920 family protein [Hwanghaeella grinnelliae]